MKKSIKTTLAKTLAVVMAFSLAGVTGVSADAASKKPSMPKKVSVTVKKTKTVKVTSKKAVKKTTWSVSNKKVVKLSKKAKKSVKVKGLKKGTATLTAKVKVGKKTYKLKTKVTVKKVTNPTAAPSNKPTAAPTNKPTTTPTGNNGGTATAVPTATPVNVVEGKTIDESKTWSIPLTDLNETTLTSATKREDAAGAQDTIKYNKKDGSVTFVSAKEYNSGVSYYVNPVTSKDQLIDISDTRGDGFTGYDDGLKDMSDYDYVRVTLKSSNEMNFRTYNDNNVIRSQGFPGSTSSETYEGGWVGPASTDTYMESDGGTGNMIKEAYQTRTLFIPLDTLQTKGDNRAAEVAVAMCPQRDGQEVTIYSMDFVKVKVDKKVSSIKVTSNKEKIENGKSGKMTAEVLEADATRKYVKWSSSNEELATVNYAGAVTAAAEGTGTVTITATAQDGSGVTGSVDVEVGPAEDNTKPLKSATLDLASADIVGKTNPGEGAAIVATSSATGIAFETGKNMAFVDFSAYLTSAKLDLANYASVSVSFKVVDAEGKTITTNPDATYGKVALVASGKLNGYDSGINKWLNSDEERCGTTATISLAGKTAAEIGEIAGFNLQLGGVPAGAAINVTGIKFNVDYNTYADLTSTDIVGKTNPGEGAAIAATASATGITFETGKNMAFVDFSAYLTAQKIDLANYKSIGVTFKVVDAEGKTITTNPDATYGKVALVASGKLNGYDSGINKWLNSDEERCGTTATISFAGKTAAEIGEIAGFNLQLGGVPAAAQIVVTGISFNKDYNVDFDITDAGIVGKTNPGEGAAIAATASATGIEFETGKNMAFVSFADYLTSAKIDLAEYDAVSVSFKVVDAEGKTVATNPDATYGKVALVASGKLNGYDSGINKWLNSDAERCATTATVSLVGKTAAEIGEIAGFNLQLGGVPAGSHIVVTGITAVYNV